MRTSMIVSQTGKKSDSGWPIIQAIVTSSGMTKRAIWIDEPMAIVSERSILSLTETVTAVTCSAAFPTRGRRMRATNSREMPPSVVKPSIEPMRNSAVTPVMTTTIKRMRKACQRIERMVSDRTSEDPECRGKRRT